MTVLVIGAASTIAQEVQKIYAGKNVSFALVARNANELTRIAQDLLVRGAQKVKTWNLDLNDFSRHHNLIEEIWSEMGVVDRVLIAHGSLGDQEKAEQDQKEFLSIIQTNYTSQISIANEIARRMRMQKSGILGIISSVAGERGKQSNYIYGSAKAGLSVYADGLRNRLFSSGVHVVTLKLGFVDTAMTASFKKGPLWARSENVGYIIVQSMEKKKGSVFIPFFWRYIMCVIQSIPDFLFKKLKL